MADLLETTTDLTSFGATALDCLTTPALLTALRFLTGPFISEDDLKTVAEVDSLAASRLRSDSECVRRIVQVIAMGLDRRRFAWLSEGREATEAERMAAIQATAAIMATQRASTDRRSAGKRALESMTEAALERIGLKKQESRKIRTFADAPAPGEFYGECELRGQKADFVVRLWDTRILAIECKASNSAVNSFKRLNREAVGKAAIWIAELGSSQVVPAAVLSGVFKTHNLVDAQQRNLTVIWGHQLSVLADWIIRTRTGARA